MKIRWAALAIVGNTSAGGGVRIHRSDACAQRRLQSVIVDRRRTIGGQRIGRGSKIDGCLGYQLPQPLLIFDSVPPAILLIPRAEAVEFDDDVVLQVDDDPIGFRLSSRSVKIGRIVRR